MKKGYFWVGILLALYGYVLIRIILFKFHPVDLGSLWDRLQYSLEYPNRILRQIHEGNLTPFKEISSTLHHTTSNGLINLIGNIAVFVPFGFLLGLLSINTRIAGIVAFLLSLGFSLCLEGAQVLFLMGRLDVDDLILNSSGGLLGCLLLHLLRRGMSLAFRRTVKLLQ
jgi:glycopeptide antibiotics resistance protein